MIIDKILENHLLWLKDHSKGQRADLSGADLSGADLSEANLRGANLREAYLSFIEGKTIYVLNSTKYTAFYIKEDDLITIGCQSHKVDVWMEKGKEIALSNGFTEKEIEIYSNWVEAIRNI